MYHIERCAARFHPCWKLIESAFKVKGAKGIPSYSSVCQIVLVTLHLVYLNSARFKTLYYIIFQNIKLIFLELLISLNIVYCH